MAGFKVRAEARRAHRRKLPATSYRQFVQQAS
jgi:hypothetical protein